jgi:hypothetical protein
LAGIFSKNKKKKLNYLEMTPFAIYSHEINSKGNIDVLVPRFTDKVFGKLLQPRLKNKYIKANLDEFGSATWLFIDGNNSVTRIGELLTEKFGEQIQPVYDRLTLFLTQLYNAGFISFNELERN